MKTLQYMIALLVGMMVGVAIEASKIEELNGEINERSLAISSERAECKATLSKSIDTLKTVTTALELCAQRCGDQ